MSVTRPDPAPLTVLVVDDHKTFADLLRIAIDAEPDFTCVGTAHGVAGAIVEAERLHPDIILMDVQLGEGDGVDATATITARNPEARVVVLTAHADAALMRRAAGAGACCLLPKDGSLTELLNALRTARRGGFVVHPTLMKDLIVGGLDRAPRIPPLSDRECDVLQMLAIGMGAAPIADQLGISLNTCRGYVKSLLSKLNAHSQLEAVAVANKHGLIHASTGR